ATSSAVARSPAMIAAGSPGARCNSAKTNTVTTMITGTAASKRRIRKTCTTSPDPRMTLITRRLLLLDIPKHEPGCVENAGEILPVCDRRQKLTGWNIRHHFVETLLQALDDLLLLLGRRHGEFQTDLLQLLVAGPAEPVLA